MSKIIDYRTAEGENPGNLDQKVKALISEGYQPHGSPYTIGGQICQAMIKANDRPAAGARRGF
jgi:hypothetical protein